MHETEQLSPDETKRRRKNRRLFIGLFLCFVIPLVAAHLILAMEWYTPGVTNKGELIEPPLEFSAADNSQLPQTWRLAYPINETCDDVCTNGLYIINQAHQALGRERNRVTPVAIRSQHSDNELPTQAVASQLQSVQLNDAHDVLSSLPVGSVYIIDPEGFVIMRYRVTADREQSIESGRDMLDDLHKLLKMSRVG